MGKQDDKDAKWPGFPERLREAFQRAGFWKKDRPDIMRFVAQHGIQHGIHVTYCYKYINGETVPDRERLVALAQALGVRPWWLLFGDEAMAGAGDNPRGKETRRQGRRTAGSLVLALMCGLAATLGLPSGVGASELLRARDIIPAARDFSFFSIGYGLLLLRRRVALWLWPCTLSPVAA